METIAPRAALAGGAISAHVCLFVNDEVTVLTDLASAVEQRGFHGLFVPENTHMPVKRRRASPYPEARMKSLATLYDPFVCLGACAAVTTRIKLGISVCLLTHRDAIATARAAASLDALCGGRLILGVAGGFVAEAMENHGSAFKHRWAIVAEKTAAMRTIWRSDEPEFHGRFVDFVPFPAKVRPQQVGGPPIWIGSNHSTVTRKVADYADGWFIFEDRYRGDPFVDLRAACDERERDVRDITVALMDAPQDAAELDARIERGYRDFVFLIRVENTAHALHSLDRLSRLMDELGCGLADAGADSVVTF